MKESSIKKKKGSERIYGLDGLRALAIIGVTLFHMFPSVIKGGYLGVSLFFVISGYLLAKTGEKKRRRQGFHAAEFYVKRIARIYPAMLLVIFMSAGVFFLLDRKTLDGIRPELYSIVFGYNNYWQIAQNADYFTRITNASPFTHMWFMAVEIQFYLLWPAIYMGYIYLRQNINKKAGLRFLMVLTVISALLTPILYQPGMDVTRLYYGTDTRVYALLFGVWLGMAQGKRFPAIEIRRLARDLVFPLLAVFLLIIGYAYFVMDGQLAFVYQGGMILMTLLFGLLVLFVTDKKVPAGSWLEAKPLVWIGQRSFEIYLWQYPVIFLFMIKEWDDIPGAPLMELALIVLLAAWLHGLVDVVFNGIRPALLMKSSFEVQSALKAAGILSAVFVVIGIAGICLAPREKFAEKDELAKRLEENQRMLQERRENAASGTDAEVSSTPTPTPNPLEEMTLLYADPDLTNSAPVSLEGVLMIGDSIMLDSSPALMDEFPDCYIDAVQSRMVFEGADAAQVEINEGNLNQTVVISLGTNEPLTESNISAILDVFGPDISVFWVNLFGRTVTWDKEANQLLLDMTEKYTNLTIIDWKSVIQDHTEEWLWPDMEHPNLEGSVIYAKLIRESLEVVAAKQRAEGSTE